MKKIKTELLISLLVLIFVGTSTKISSQSLTSEASIIDTIPKRVLRIDEFIVAKSDKLIELTDPMILADSIKIDFNSSGNEETNNKDLEQYLICKNGSPRNANFLIYGNGGKLYVKFTEAKWGRYNNWVVRNTCGNFWPSNRRFTFPDPRAYQYQMVLLEVAPGITRYYVNLCREDVTYYVNTKRGFKYYIYTNDTRGDHDDNRGYISYCFGLR